MCIISAIEPIVEIPEYADSDEDEFPEAIQLIPLKRGYSSSWSSVDWIDATKTRPLTTTTSLSSTSSSIIGATSNLPKIASSFQQNSSLLKPPTRSTSLSSTASNSTVTRTHSSTNSTTMLSRIPTFTSAIDFLPDEDNDRDFIHSQENIIDEEDRDEPEPIIPFTAVDSSTSSSPLKQEDRDHYQQQIYEEDIFADEDVAGVEEEMETMLSRRSSRQTGIETVLPDEDVSEGEAIIPESDHEDVIEQEDDETAHSEEQESLIIHQGPKAVDNIPVPMNPAINDRFDFDDDDDNESDIFDRLSAKKRRRQQQQQLQATVSESVAASVKTLASPLQSSVRPPILPEPIETPAHLIVVDAVSPPTQINNQDAIEIADKVLLEYPTKANTTDDFPFPVPRPMNVQQQHNSPQQLTSQSKSSKTKTILTQSSSPPLSTMQPLNQIQAHRPSFSQRMQSQVQQDLGMKKSQIPTTSGIAGSSPPNGKSPIRPLERTAAMKELSVSSLSALSSSSSSSASLNLFRPPTKVGVDGEIDESAPLMSRVPSIYDHQQSFDPSLERLRWDYVDQQSMQIELDSDNSNSSAPTQVSQAPFNDVPMMTQLSAQYHEQREFSRSPVPTSTVEQLQTTSSTSHTRGPSPNQVPDSIASKLLALLEGARSKVIEIDGVVYDFSAGELKPSSSAPKRQSPVPAAAASAKPPSSSSFVLSSQPSVPPAKKRQQQPGQIPFDEWIDPVAKPKKMKQLTLDVYSSNNNKTNEDEFQV